jgi:hypothetical protein
MFKLAIIGDIDVLYISVAQRHAANMGSIPSRIVNVNPEL